MTTEHCQSTKDSQDTLSTRFAAHTRARHRILKASVLWHPDLDMVGHALAVQFDANRQCALSRHDPAFLSATGDRPQSLAWAGVSRTPVVLEKTSTGLSIHQPDSRMRVCVQGDVLTQTHTLTDAQLAVGVSLSFGDQVILWLQHSGRQADRSHQQHPFIGISDAAIRVREQIAQFGPTPANVLIRGDTGTGKELVAQQLHQLSQRADQLYLSLNMATLTESLAASELFGAVKGSFTGASTDKRGLFQTADGGTLFLDEIGDTPAAVQPMLLRALEAGEIRPVGSQHNQTVDVRVLAATDRQLETAVSPHEDGFNQPLLRRLESLQINIPPLCDRKADIGILLVHFLDQLRGELGLSSLAPRDMLDVSALLAYNWPGNVRELKHRLQTWYLTGELSLPTSTTAKLQQSSPKRRRTDRVSEVKKYQNPKSISDDALLEALEDHAWLIKPAAEALNVSRTSFYSLLARCDAIREAKDIKVDEIIHTLKLNDQQLGISASALKTPREALKQRLRELKIQFRE